MTNAKRDAAANKLFKDIHGFNPNFLSKECGIPLEITFFNNAWDARDAEVAELRAQVEFCKMYYKPDDTSFKTMIETFVELSDEQKDALIELTKALLKTKDAK